MAHILSRMEPLLHRTFPRLSDMLALSRQRRDLARLDSDRLADLGLSREAALEEAQRPAWDVPRHWRA